MPTRSLPPRPSLDQLKRQAHELRREHDERNPSAAARIVAHHPRHKTRPLPEILDTPLTLADAQLVIAREYGFETWAELKHRTSIAAEVANFHPHPLFDDALAALDAGDTERLGALLASDRTLVDARTNLDPPFHYFTGATLLHHVAGNPSRGRLEGTRPPLPANSATLARILLEHGADVDAVTLGPNGGDVMGLLLTSKQASDANVVGPLVDVLLEFGATLDVSGDDCLAGSLANHAPRAAEKMIALGARPSVLSAAALGNMELLQQFFDADGRLIERPRRHGKQLTERDAVGLALLYAYVREQREAADFLLDKDGNWDVTGVNNGAALHRAAIAGDLPMVEKLVARGADTSNRDNPFNSTPLAWADHDKQQHVVDWLRAHTVVDIHDAVGFGFSEHVEARLQEDPALANLAIDQWDIPMGTPLHWAAAMGRDTIASLLLDAGADPNALAGNGATPLDIAEASGARDVAELIEARGGQRRATRGSA